MVPPGVISVTICGNRGRTLTAGYQALVTALNALPTHSSTRSCTLDPRLHEPRYRLLFSYRQGPPVEVFLQGNCSPPIDNGGLQADRARLIVPIIQRLLR
jgi:hypothetical protein